MATEEDDRIYFGDDFGQKIDLTVRIREILRNYPEGTSIFKEMVQNADDAGATEVQFCLDHRHHSSAQLAYKKLSSFQGPSLLVFNNATFTEADFQSIQRIGDSLKKDNSKGWKTGRFGVGFNSVYHLTDLPAFVSGSHMVFFDPQACHLPNVNPSNPGKMINFMSHPELITQFPDQFTPFRAFECDFQSQFDGTIFRLPLRSDDQAQRSRLSNRPQPPVQVAGMLNEFAESLDLILLFLRNVSKISVLEWKESCAEPSVLCEAHISNMTGELQTKRSLRDSMLNAGNKSHRQFSGEGVVCDYEVDILITQATDQISCRRYVISNQLGGGECSQIANNPANSSQRLVPWGGVAVRVPEGDSALSPNGLAFCFLPLPTHTYLPVHVNGYFELSSNRRDIWFGEGLSGDGLLRAQWNIALLTDVIGPCYARTVVHLADAKRMKPHIHAGLFPPAMPPAPWDTLASSMLKMIKTKPCLFTEADGGTWISPATSLVVKRSVDKYDSVVQWLLDDDVFVVRNLTEQAENVLVASTTIPAFLDPRVARKAYTTISSNHAGNRAAIECLLGFMLQDVTEDNVGVLADVKFLPLANGSLTSFRATSSETSRQLDELCAMGFSRSHSIRALRAVGGQDVEAALNWLFSNPNPSASKDEDQTGAATFFVPTEDELRLLQKASSYLVDISALPRHAMKVFSSKSMEQQLNVRQIDMRGFEDLLSYVFPSAWYGKQSVPWNSDDAIYRHLDEEWFRLLWKYVGPSDQLSQLQDKWPIVPTESGIVCMLSRSARVVSPELIPALCLRALNKLAVPVLLQNLFAAIRPHPDVWKYIHQPTPGGVLSSLANLRELSDLDVKIRFKAVGKQEREHIREFLLSGMLEDLTEDQKVVLCKLPIFEGVCTTEQADDDDVKWLDEPNTEKESGLVPIFVCLVSGNGAYRKFCPGMGWRILDDSFIHVKDDQNTVMVTIQRLNVERVSKATFLAEFLIPRFESISHSAKIQFVCQLLRETTAFLAEDADGVLARTMDTLPIFPSLSGETKRIVDLYDPEIDEFVRIMDDSFFPAIELQAAQPLAVLRSLGLQRTLSRRSILSIAMSIEADATQIQGNHDMTLELDNEKSSLEQRAVEVFKYVESHIDQLTSITYRTQQKVPKRNVKAQGLKILRSFIRDDRGNDSIGHNQMADMEERDRQASELLEIEDFKAKLSAISWIPVSSTSPYPEFPWYRKGEGVIVASPNRVRLPKDLALCSAQFHILHDSLNGGTLRPIFKWNEPIDVEYVAKQMKALAVQCGESTNLEGQVIWPVVFDIYKILSRFLEAEVNQDRRSVVLGILSGDFPYIWVGGRFRNSHQVALSTLVNAEPYLHVVPSELVHFRPFLKAVGVRDSFSLGDYVNVLGEMFAKCQPPLPAEGTLGFPLPHDELVTAIGLIQLVSDTLPHHSDYELYAPDTNGILARTVELTFDDAPWLDKGDTDVGVLRIVHPKISNEVASKIGAQSLRSLLLHANQLDSLVFSSSNSDVSAFGQTEALTKRIAHILEQYPDGPHIISELIQNADDAGATRVCLLYSNVTYGTSSLLSPAMAKWQGPALYSYNDAEFKESDFLSLARIGQGAKLQQVATTGRFGLGFNSVYHFTDLPSILSANSLVMFDPHATNLPGITPANPGIKIRFVNSNLPKQFPDQFEPYKQFGCTLDGHFNGTLFRFPLRHEGVSASSEIKQRAYSGREIVDLFESFRSSITSAMIFLRNVRKVEVYVQQDASSPPSLLYDAEIPVQDRGESWRSIDRFMVGDGAPKVGDRKGSQTTTKRAFYSRLQRTSVEELPSETQVLHIHSRQLTNISDALASLREISLDAPATLGDDQAEFMRSTETYLVCNQIGGGRARDMACAEENESLKLIPWVGVAGRIDNTLTDGRAFCFLPLPVRTGLPVHVNGYFEISSNRRDIWHGDDLTGDGKLRSEWNSHLLTDAVAPAYLTFLQEAKTMCGEDAGKYLAFFPKHLPVEPWASMVRSLFGCAKDKLVLTTSPSSHNPGKSIAPARSVIIDERVNGWEVLEEALNQVSIDTVRIPPHLQELFVQFNAVRGVLTPSFFRRLLRNGQILPALDVDTVTAAIQFCVSDCRDDAAVNDLNGLPILPVLDGSYKPVVIVDVNGPTSFTACYFVKTKEAELLADFPDQLMDAKFQSIFDSVPNLYGRSNIQVMTLADMCRDFLPKILPAAWESADNVEWVTSENELHRHPSIEWVNHLWGYLDESVDSSLDSFDILFKWPILPIVGGEDKRRLIRLGGSSIPVVERPGTPHFPDIAVLPTVLLKLGILTVDSSIVSGRQIVEWMLENVVLRTLNLDSVLSAIGERVSGGDFNMDTLFSGVGSEKAILVDFIVGHSLDAIGEDNLALLRELPIFPVYRTHSSATTDPDRRSLSCGARLPGDDADGRVLDESFYVATDSATRAFLRTCGVEEWSLTRILLEHVFPNLSEFVQRDEALAVSVIADALIALPFHQRSNSSFRDTIRSTPIIPSQKRLWRKIGDLYDPNNQDLAELVGPNSLPSDTFSTPELVDILRSLGLRSSLSCHAIVESAKTVEALNADASSIDAAWAKSHSLLKLVNRSFDEMTTQLRRATDEEGVKEIIADLYSIEWLPVRTTPLNPFMPWAHDVEANGKRISSAEKTRPEADSWMCSFSKDILAGQLLSEELIVGFGWRDTVEPEVVAAQLRSIGLHHRAQQELTSVADTTDLVYETRRMYQLLDNVLRDGDEGFSNLRTTLEGARWVWSGTNFVTMQQLAVNADAELEPLLFAAPPELVVPRSLLNAFDLKERFTPTDYIMALKSLPVGGSLTKNQRNTCVKLFSLLARAIVDGEDLSNTSADGFVLLDEHDRLHRAQLLTYDDMEWDESSAVRRGCRFVSKDVAREVALALGAISLHSKLAEASASSTRVFCPPSHTLHKILPSKSTWCHTLYTEIMVAAEHFGGTQVDFFVDYRKHPAQRVVQPSFQPLQEEALCIHIHGVVLESNDVNTLFGGEMSRPGFLAGFFLSDCLQILSGDGFYVLDPTNSFLVSSDESPATVGTARRYDILTQEFMRYPDQLLPFCTLPSCPGNVGSGTRSTLLRFPWRKKKSSLSNGIFDIDHAARFVAFLKAQLRESVVFTEYVHRVTVWSVGKDSEFATQCHGVAALDSPDYTLKQRNASRVSSEWKKKFSFHSFFKTPVVPESQLEFVVHIELENKKYSDTWLISDNIGAGRSRDLASSPIHEVLNSVPFVSVACHLFRDGKPAPYLRGRLFDVLSTGQLTGLPVHINGCFKMHLNESALVLDTTNPNINDDRSIKAQWNRVLLEDNAVDAYLKLLLVAKRRYENSVPKAFYRVWPTSSEKPKPIARMVQSCVYRQIASHEFFLCTDGSFRSLHSGYVVDIGSMDLQVVSFAQIHFPSLDIPGRILTDVNRLVPSRVNSLTPRTMRRFLRTLRTSDIHSSVCLSLLEYCLSDFSFPLPSDTDSVWSELQGLPLLPLEDGQVGLLGKIQQGRYILGSFNQIQLLGTLSGMFVSLDARQRLHAFFADTRFVSQIGLAYFSIKVLSDHIERILPAEWKHRAMVTWNPSEPRQISQIWLYRFWNEVHYERRSLAYFSAWPLIPVQGSRLLSCGKPDVALCVWSGSVDVDLRDLLQEQFDASARMNEAKLAEQEKERRELKELASTKLQSYSTQDEYDRIDEDVADSLLLGDPDDEEDAVNGDSVADDVHTDLDESKANEEDEMVVPDTRTVETVGEMGQTLVSGQVAVEGQHNDSVYNAPLESERVADGNAHTTADTDIETVLHESGSSIQPIDTEYTSREVIHNHLVRLNAAMLELSYLHGQANDIIPSSRTVTIAVLDGLHGSNNVLSLKWDQLSESDATMLAEYFSYHGQRHGGYNRMHIDMLKTFPIYVTVDGLCCPLLQGEHFLVPPEIDLTAIPLPNSARESFMKANPQLVEFYKELGVQEMSYVKLLVYMLPYYSELQPEQCHAVLELIRQKWQSLRGNSELVGMMRSTRLFADENGQFYTADSFYDTRNTVLRTIYGDMPQSFPPPQFQTDEWLELMGEIGLQSEITVDLFVECAQRLEATYASKSALDPSDEIVINCFHRYFIQNFEKYDRSRVLFDRIAPIKFVPAVVYENAVSTSCDSTDGTGLVSRTVLTKYSECATPEDQALVFSAMPVLLSSAMPPRLLWSRLGIESPPQKTIVLDHFFRITSGTGNGSITEQWHFFLPIEEVFQAIFKYLQSNWNDIASLERRRLARSAIIPVGSSLVKGSRLFFHLPENLAPLMYEVPRVFGAYDALFRHLGSKDTPDVQDYVYLLRDLHAECGESCLNLNELVSVTRVVGLLADALAESNHALSMDSLQSMYLPSSVSVMRQVLQMAYNDAPWICARVDLAELYVVHPRINVKQCGVLGVKGISEVVTEELDTKDLRPCGQIDEVDHFNSVMISTQFGNGLRTVISAQQQKASSHDQLGPSADFDELDKRIVGLARYEVRAVETLRSSFIARLGHPPRRVDVTKSSAATGSVSFIDTTAHVIYVALHTLDANPGIRRSQVVANAINQLLGGVLQDTAAIESILSCDVLDIQPRLQFLNIYEDPELIVEKLRGTQGEVLADSDRQLIGLAPLRSYYVGEIVAVDSDGSGELRYGKISSLASASADVPSFEVRIGRADKKWYPATHIYSFNSSRDNGPTQSTEARNMAFVERLARSQQAGSSAVDEASGDSSQLPASVTTETFPPICDVGSVALPAPAITIVSAVNDLLGRLNLSLDATHEELIAENMRLQKQLKQAEEGRRIAAAQVEEAIRERKDAQDSLVCAICLENNVNSVLIPCGHIYCGDCISRLPRPSCPICRQSISATSVFHVPS